MGGRLSTGSNQDQLCDYLMESGYLRNPGVEKIMRSVDRVNYISYTGGLDGPPLRIVYRDQAWKHDYLHISAPCIYAEALENLQLRPGLSFLNIGSGTGYLSTVVGLFLGPYGVNHGIELSSFNIEFARQRLAAFTATSPAIDAFHFCPPVFVEGCGLQLKDCGRQYDRVYCGATVPNSHKQQMMDLLKVGGILVMPFQDNLVQVTRINETEWQWKSVLPVSFLNLIPSKGLPPELPAISPIRLDEACRAVIRGEVRKAAELAYPGLTTHHRSHKAEQNCKSSSDSDEDLPQDNWPILQQAAYAFSFDFLSAPVDRPKQRTPRAKREKFDSGVVLPESDSDSNQSDEEDEEDEGCIPPTVTPPQTHLQPKTKIRQRMDSIDSDSSNSPTTSNEDTDLPPLYSVIMREKMSQLPLPPAMLAYLNYYRD